MRWQVRTHAYDEDHTLHEERDAQGNQKEWRDDEGIGRFDRLPLAVLYNYNDKTTR